MTTGLNSNELHINAVLVHLPYDADKLAGKEGLDFQQHGDVFSFNDTQGNVVHYKVIVDSDEAVRGTNEYGADQDMAAFVEVDAAGNEIQKNGHAHVVVAFPGLNSPMADAGEAFKEYTGKTAFDPKVYNNFIQDLGEQLTNRGMAFNQVDVVSHSLGTSNGLHYQAQFGSESMMMMEGWKKKGALETAINGAIIAESNSATPLSEAEYKQAFQEKYEAMQHGLIQVEGGSFTGEFLTKDVAIAENIVEIEGAGHFAGGFLFKEQSNVTTVDKDVNIDKYADKSFDKSEKRFVQELKNALKSDGNFTKEDRDILKDVRATLNAAGLQVEEMQEIRAQHIEAAELKGLPMQQR